MENLDFPTPSPGFLLDNKRTESKFEEIPVMSTIYHLYGFRRLSYYLSLQCRDFSNMSNTDPIVRRALADQIRDACINGG